MKEAKERLLKRKSSSAGCNVVLSSRRIEGAVEQGGQVVELFAGEGREEGNLARVRLFGKDAGVE